MVPPNAWWPAPPLHLQPRYLQQLCRGMSCLTSPILFIDLGPFADQDCTIVFTTTAVKVYYPDGHPILSGWRDETGLQLWHFPLTAEATNPQDATGATAPWPPIPTPAPLLAPPPRITSCDEWQALHPAQLFHHYPVKDTASHGTILLPIGWKGVSDQRVRLVSVL
jgi:hypothetical protein